MENEDGAGGGNKEGLTVRWELVVVLDELNWCEYEELECDMIAGQLVCLSKGCKMIQKLWSLHTYSAVLRLLVFIAHVVLAHDNSGKTNEFPLPSIRSL